MKMVPDGTRRQPAATLPRRLKERGVEMPWFPDFVGAVELARRETRAAGQLIRSRSTSPR